MLVTTVNATQKEIAPLMFDLIKIQDYHPLMGTARIIGDQTEGVGKHISILDWFIPPDVIISSSETLMQ